jgi:hypothetical protein
MTHKYKFLKKLIHVIGNTNVIKAHRYKHNN